jgi:hypothetical protein
MVVTYIICLRNQKKKNNNWLNPIASECARALKNLRVNMELTEDCADECWNASEY